MVETLNPSTSLTDTIISKSKLIIFILDILFILGIFLPWLHYIPSTSGGSELLIFGIGLDFTLLIPIIFLIPILILIIVVLSIFNINKPKNNLIIVFFLSIVLLLLMISHLIIWNTWIDRFTNYPIETRTWLNIYFGIGIWLCTLSAFLMVCFSLLAAHKEKQFVRFRNWTIQKKIFVILLLICFLIFHPHRRFYSMIFFVGLLLLFSVVIEVEYFFVRGQIVWALTFFFFVVIFFQNIYLRSIVDIFYQSRFEEEPIILLILNIILFIILIWAKITYTDMFELKPEPEHIIIQQPKKQIGKTIVESEIKEAPRPTSELIQKPMDISKSTQQSDITLKELSKNIVPKIINKEETIEHYENLFNVNTKRATNLFTAGYTSINEFNDAIPEDLIMVEGINPTLARKIIDVTKMISK
jgi:hypothetical protein